MSDLGEVESITLKMREGGSVVIRNPIRVDVDGEPILQEEWDGEVRPHEWHGELRHRLMGHSFTIRCVNDEGWSFLK